MTAAKPRGPAEPRQWTPAAIENLIERIRRNERNAVDAAIAFIGQDTGLPFGMILKSATARALRQYARLDAAQTERLRARFTDMLLRGYLPREYKQYARLFRKIGLGDHRATIEAKADMSNPFVRRWCWYLLVDHGAPRPSRHRRPW